MSVARGSQNGGHFYSNIVMPQAVTLQFTVNHSDSGGLGITSLKSNGWVRYVFMNTSATPGVVDGITNPNPIAGLVIIQMKQNYNVFVGAECVPEVTTTGGAVTSPTAGHVYQIGVLGSTTLAQWQTAGLPVGFTPTVGQVFVAGPGGALGGSGSVLALTTPGYDNFNICGNPNGLINNSNIASNGGSYLVGQFILAGSLAAPTDGTVISMRLYFDRSSVTVDGL